MDFKKRIDCIQKNITKSKREALLILGSENIFYLTNFWGSFGLLLLTKDKVFLFVDGRYYEKAKVSSSLCEVVLFQNLMSVLKKVLNEAKIKTVYFEPDDVSYSFYCLLKKEIKNTEFLSVKKSLVRELRMFKDSEEINIIKKAVKVSKDIYSNFYKKHFKVGVTEKSLAANLEFLIKTKTDGVSFDTIVASGKNASLPHATPSSKKLSPDETVIIDYGIKWKGYCTDHTTTTIIGDSKLNDYYSLVKEAIKVGLDVVKPNNAISAVDKKIREFFDKKDVLKHFLHSSGHGIGLNVHEKPTLSYKEKGVFKKGMIFTIEPGLYFEGIGGIRLEEMFLVTDDGFEIL